MLNTILREWKKALIIVVVVDLLVLMVGAYFVFATDLFAAPEIPDLVLLPTPKPTPTLWAGPPGGTSTPRPNLPPTPTATTILAQSGFPHGFTPTPRPTREPVYISLPLFGGNSGRRDLPDINQVLYPEPFFPPGTNNACGPIALYAGFLGLGVDVDYTHLRNIAVDYGFAAHGISTSGMVNTTLTLNHELGNPLNTAYGYNYNTNDLIRQLRRGRVVVVLVQLYQVNGRYYLTSDPNGAIGHFLLVENINTRRKTVRFAGSTLGIEEVSLGDFVASWSLNPEAVDPPQGWSSFLRHEPAQNWALIMDKN